MKRFKEFPVVAPFVASPGRDASNIFRTIAQSSSVIHVRIVGLQMPTAHKSQIS
jgi:hypothetical protein